MIFKPTSILIFASFLLVTIKAPYETRTIAETDADQTTYESTLSQGSVDACNTVISSMWNKDQKIKKLIDDEKGGYSNFREALVAKNYDKMPLISLCTDIISAITADCLNQKILFFKSNESTLTDLEKEVTGNKGKICYQLSLMNAQSYIQKVVSHAVSKSINLSAAKKWHKQEYLKIIKDVNRK